jgi:hypothetical protein
MSEGGLGEIIDWLMELLEANGAEVTNLIVADGEGSEIEFVRDGRTYSLLISQRGSEQENERH